MSRKAPSKSFWLLSTVLKRKRTRTLWPAQAERSTVMGSKVLFVVPSMESEDQMTPSSPSIPTSTRSKPGVKGFTSHSLESQRSKLSTGESVGTSHSGERASPDAGWAPLS